MASEKQLEANRKNAQRSSGPKTEEGKAQSRLNAIKHGLRAEALAVLPNEDPEAYRERLDAWIESHRPRTPAEDDLVHLAADFSWKIIRARRHETSSLSRRVGEAMSQAEQARHDQVSQAARRLLPSAGAVERSGLDRVEAIRLRVEVESTAAGCRWLIAAWRNLRDLAASGRPWSHEQELHAIRLLGHGPGPIANPLLIDLVVANRTVLDPDNPLTAEDWSDGPLQTRFDRAAIPGACDRRPATPAEAFALMVSVADGAIARLEGVLAERERGGDRAALDAAEAGAIASFDPSMGGEQLRRYQFSLHRALIRTLDALDKLRREESKPKRGDEASIGAIESNPAPPDERTAAVIQAQEPDGPRPPDSPAPNEPNPAPNVQFSFAKDDVRSVDPVRPIPPNEPDRSIRKRRKESRRLLALARRANRPQSGK